MNNSNDLCRSPWARSWLLQQQDKSKPALPRDRFGEVLFLVVALLLTAVVAAQVGMVVGREDGRKIGKAETWAQHYESYAKVQWLIDEANLKEMWVKR